MQAIYGYPADGTDRYDPIAPLIQGWAASNVDDVFSESAADAGGDRHVRFVHDASCNVIVTKFEFSSTGDDSFGSTIPELIAAGFSSHQRMYRVRAGVWKSWRKDTTALFGWSGRAGSPWW